MTTPSLAKACHTIRRTSRYEQRRHVRAMALHYNRSRDLVSVLGWQVPTYCTGGPIVLTQRIIRALGHRLHYQVMSDSPMARRRIQYTRKALFGEILGLWHLQQEAKK